ncbi:MAG: 50S ribosomal protein L11 methyltransferase [Verrucomicrobiota bacterium]
MKKSLWQVSLTLPEEAEDPVTALFKNIFGQTPSIFTNAATHKTTASIYLAKTEWSKSRALALEIGLRDLRAMGIAVKPEKIRLTKLASQDWAESWKKHFKPIQIGGKLLVKPSWSKLRPKKNQVCIVLDPGLSFGTGQHATTRFCLERIVHCRRSRPQSFLDIGTGSGILALAAAKLGYAPVEAFDFDPDAVRISLRNAEKNFLRREVKITHQDLTRFYPPADLKFDLICANLICDLLIAEREKISGLLKPGGSLILAGVLKSQFAGVRRAYEKLGMTLRKAKVEKEWQSGHFFFNSPP